MAYQSTTNPLDISTERIAEGQRAGDEYTGDLELIRDTLDANDNSGTTLGTMVSSQLKLTEADTRYQIRSGIPNKVSKAVKDAAGEVKRAAS